MSSLPLRYTLIAGGEIRLGETVPKRLTTGVEQWIGLVSGQGIIVIHTISPSLYRRIGAADTIHA
jgi:hypothetical protein